MIRPEGGLVVERTLAILKPDCLKKNVAGEVIARIEKAGFTILGMRMVRLTKETAGGFYTVHRERPFFNDLVTFMSSGKCVPIALEKENAVADFRALIGATDPKDAAPGTIRKDFASSKGENIVHGSDSVENGRLEIAYFFAEKDIVEAR
jgi:nucleoside-diphosphate kinase